MFCFARFGWLVVFWAVGLRLMDLVRTDLKWFSHRIDDRFLLEDPHLSDRIVFPDLYMIWLMFPGVFFITMFAMYQNYVGLESIYHGRCYYETDELPNPRPSQPKKNSG